MDYLWKQETSRKIRKQELLATGQMHMKTATKVHITGHMLGHFKVADILNLMLCKRRSFNISLSSDIFLISTLCVTDVKQKLEYGSVLPQKSSMCPTDASFRWLNSVCWMWSMEDVKKKKKKVGRQNFTVLSCVYTAKFIDFVHMPVAWLRFSTP